MTITDSYFISRSCSDFKNKIANNNDSLAKKYEQLVQISWQARDNRDEWADYARKNGLRCLAVSLGDDVFMMNALYNVKKFYEESEQTPEESILWFCSLYYNSIHFFTPSDTDALLIALSING